MASSEPTVELKEGERLTQYKGKWVVECDDGVNYDRGRPCGQQWSYWDRISFTFFEDDACTKRKNVCVQYMLYMWYMFAYPTHSLSLYSVSSVMSTSDSGAITATFTNRWHWTMICPFGLHLINECV